eukprot:gene8278-5797_t
MPIRGVFVDMDGTLLEDDSRVSAFTLQVLNALDCKGIPLVIATGRPAPSVFHTMKKCGLSPVYVITSNGAVISNGNGDVIARHTIDADIARRLLSIQQQPKEDGAVDVECPPKRFTTNVYSGTQWYTDMVVPQVQEALGPAMIPTIVDFKNSGAFINEIDNLWFLGNAEDMPAVLTHIRRHYSPEVTPAMSLPYLCDVASAGVNKGSAVSEVCELLGIPTTEVAAFGDGMNDLDMLNTVGHPHIMENGQEELKRALPGATVVGRNSEDGVAKRLSQTENLKWNERMTLSLTSIGYQEYSLETVKQCGSDDSMASLNKAPRSLDSTVSAMDFSFLATCHHRFLGGECLFSFND